MCASRVVRLRGENAGGRKIFSLREYQVRIAGRDAGENELSARLNEPLKNGAVIHIVPRLAGAKSGGVFQAVLGAALIAVAWWNPAGWLGAAALPEHGTGRRTGGFGAVRQPAGEP